MSVLKLLEFQQRQKLELEKLIQYMVTRDYDLGLSDWSVTE